MPDDELFEYLATQAVAGFLATEASVPIDGIIFPSVQAAGDALNVVRFHKAAHIEALTSRGKRRSRRQPAIWRRRAGRTTTK